MRGLSGLLAFFALLGGLYFLFNAYTEVESLKVANPGASAIQETAIYAVGGHDALLGIGLLTACAVFVLVNIAASVANAADKYVGDWKWAPKKNSEEESAQATKPV